MGLPIERSIPADRQGAKRHYGVHPYFTRRPYNVVRDYIEAYSSERSLVADPFGGSGVVAIEAFLANRTGIQNDINPLANFIASGIMGLSNLDDAAFSRAMKSILGDWEHVRRCSGNWLPNNIDLPKTADVSKYHELFSPEHLNELSGLWRLIQQNATGPVLNALKLAFSATLSKTNLTFLSAEGRAESRGGSSIFSIYRYKIAKSPINLSVINTFTERARNIQAAAKEVQKIIEHRRLTSGFHGSYVQHSLDVHDLASEYRGKLDYLFTDPPYGGHISYLDLSVLWNNWLFSQPDELVRSKEMIVGGELKFSEETYIRRLHESIGDCANMLKPNAWMSVVFQHWNVRYFEAILEGARNCGAGLRAAISQIGDPIWSMHKKKNHDNVLSGELILTFQRGYSKSLSVRVKNFSIEDELRSIVRSSPVRLYGEAVLNHLVIKAWQAGALDKLEVSPSYLSKWLIDNGYAYDTGSHSWNSSTQDERKATLFS